MRTLSMAWIGARVGRACLGFLMAGSLLMAAPAAQQDGDPPNILLIVLDDIGVDLVGEYREHTDPAHTPNLDLLAQGGMLFRNAWSNPSCSPSRAAMLSGRHAFRTGWGFGTSWLNAGEDEFPVTVTALPAVIGSTYDTAAVGKWHLASSFVSGADHPLLLGFDHHRGPMDNLVDGYFAYDKYVDGVLTPSVTYATTDQVDDALALIESFAGPWFLWLAFNSAHGPFHAPPEELHTYDLPATVSEDFPMHGKAMTEALDTELGRLLSSLDPGVLADTIVIVVGDNGTSELATTAPFVPEHAKGTVYEGGVNVPLIVFGPGIPVEAESAALVSVTDIFATVAELAGYAAPTALDSVSLVPYFSDPDLSSLRSWVYTETFEPNGFLQPPETWLRAVRNDRYKLIAEYDGSFTPTALSLFDLEVDPFEADDLLGGPLNPSEQLAFASLSSVLANLLAAAYVPWVNAGFAKTGTNGPPLLSGTGRLVEGEPISIELTGALESTWIYMLLGFSNVDVAFMGGTLVPDIVGPGGNIILLPTDASGSLTLSTTWPSGVPGDLVIYLQDWIVDPGATFGFAASNALRGVTF